MSYCINPWCKYRKNPDELEKCGNCNTPLLINGNNGQQFRLIEPLRPLDEDNKTELFEVIDETGTWTEKAGTHKVMKVLCSSNPKLIELIKREADVLQLLDCPGIPRVDVDGSFTFHPNGDAPELNCLVMEKIAGYNLEDWVELNGKISQSVAIDWLKQIVLILDKLHSEGFFHRDIKPSNIINKLDGHLALIDFGAVRETTPTYMAKVARGLSKTIESGGFFNVTVIRTACYTPIEQLNGKAVLQSDFYALGRTFAFLLTGIHLHKIPNDPQTGELLWRKYAPQIAPAFADFIDELMAHLPGKRPPNTQVILQRLEYLPLQSKLRRVANSMPFKVGAVCLSLLTVFGIAKISLPLIANSLVEKGKEAHHSNHSKAAEQNFRFAVFLNPATASSISGFYFEQGSRHQAQPEVAKSYYEKVLKYNPADVDAYNNLALACQQLSDFNCASDSYKKAFKLQSNNWEGHYGLGNFYDEQGEYDLAEEQYKLAIQKSNNQAINAVNNLARLKNRNGEYEQAAELTLQGLNQTENPEWLAALHKNLGWARLEQKQYTQAKKHLQESLRLDPERTDAYCLLAQVQEALAEMNQARNSWEVCLIAQSNLPEVQSWRQQVLQRILKL